MEKNLHTYLRHLVAAAVGALVGAFGAELAPELETQLVDIATGVTLFIAFAVYAAVEKAGKRLTEKKEEG